MNTANFLHAIMDGYDRPELRLELRRRNLQPEPDGPFAGRRLFKSAWYPLTGQCLEAAYKTAQCWQRKGDVFFGVLPRAGNTRKDENVQAAGAIWVEIDGQSEGQAGALTLLHTAVSEGKVYEPAFVVGSGGGVHAYWLLAERETLTESLRSSVPILLRRLCCALGNLYWESNGALSKANPYTPYADPMSTNIGRILRVPGTWNHTASRNCPVELIEQSARRHELTLAQWDDWLPAAPKCAPVQWRPIPGAAPGTSLPRHTKDMLDQAYPEGERYEALRTILCAARHAGWSEYGMQVLAADFTLHNPGCRQEVIDDLVKATIKRIHPD